MFYYNFYLLIWIISILVGFVVFFFDVVWFIWCISNELWDHLVLIEEDNTINDVIISIVMMEKVRVERWRVLLLSDPWFLLCYDRCCWYWWYLIFVDSFWWFDWFNYWYWVISSIFVRGLPVYFRMQVVVYLSFWVRWWWFLWVIIFYRVYIMIIIINSIIVIIVRIIGMSHCDFGLLDLVLICMLFFIIYFGRGCWKFNCRVLFLFKVLFRMVII